ncbi:hypothetical protein [Lentzea sp. NPDC003310]|uniref:hypothetical protein n=1 Tax=Lentzea sp. NPDC003310 TaxID=3154447 RepID=UPI0033BB5E65
MKLESLVWLTWRQHRWAIVSVSVVALLAVYGLATTEAGDAVKSMMPIAGFYALMVQLAFGALIGMTLGAPLIARELEERTYFVAWGQDVTPAEWLRGKLIVLGGVAVVLAALVGNGDGFTGSQDTWAGFEANSLVQVGYALLGLSLGTLLGLLTRHVLTAIAGTLVFFTLTRMFLSMALRDHYLPPERSIARWEATAQVPYRSLELGRGFVGEDLEPVDVLARCQTGINENTCMRNARAAIGTYVEYQPVERMTAFQIIEFVLCALIAAGVFALVFRLMRNGGGWKPSRSHRRLGSPVPDDTSDPGQEPDVDAARQGEVVIVSESGPEVVVDQPDSSPDSSPGAEPADSPAEPAPGEQSPPATTASRTEG